MSTADVFARIIGALDHARISHMLTGSFASSYHGSPRSTQDIDLVIEADTARLRVLISSLPRDEYYVDEEAAVEALGNETQFNIIDLATGWKIDLIIRRSRPFSHEEFARRSEAEFDGTVLSIASAEDVIISKLEWAKSGGSSRQIEDVASILRIRAGELDQAYLERWIEVLGVGAEWAAASARSTGS